MNTPPDYVIRDFVPGDDDPLVFDSWMKACTMSGDPRFRWPLEARKLHRALIAELLRECPAKVAAHPEHATVLYGWICGGLTDSGLQVLHMIFVRKGWREHGIGTALLKTLFPALGEREIYYTHRTQGARRMEKKLQGIWYPYLLQELI